MERPEMKFDNLSQETRDKLKIYLSAILNENQDAETTKKFTLYGETIHGDMALFAYFAALTVLQLIENPLDLSQVNKIIYTDDTGTRVLLNPDIEEPKKISVSTVSNSYDGVTLKISNLDESE